MDALLPSLVPVRALCHCTCCVCASLWCGAVARRVEFEVRLDLSRRGEGGAGAGGHHWSTEDRRMYVLSMCVRRAARVCRLRVRVGDLARGRAGGWSARNGRDEASPSARECYGIKHAHAAAAMHPAGGECVQSNSCVCACRRKLTENSKGKLWLQAAMGARSTLPFLIWRWFTRVPSAWRVVRRGRSSLSVGRTWRVRIARTRSFPSASPASWYARASHARRCRRGTSCDTGGGGRCGSARRRGGRGGAGRW